MHSVRRALSVSLHFVAVILLVTAVSMSVDAQQGWNASVYSDSNGVNPSPSYAIVDATQFQGSDLCAMINSVFNAYNVANSKGIVIDARGVSALNCSATNPWSNLIVSENNHSNESFSNTVLLPAGTISIQVSWILPNYTHLVGQGPNTTIIQAVGLGSQDMIDMGSESTQQPMYCYTNSADCPGIVIEHLGLIGDGSGNGIVNCCAQELSRVNDVSISAVAIGLELSDRFAQNSGPYTNLTISGANTCLKIGPALNPSVTGPMTNSRGVHGLQCSVNNTSIAAITVDGPNNSLEDISISSASSNADGILVGSLGPAQGNTLLNIQGSGLKNVIEISGNGLLNATGVQNCPYTFVSGSGTAYYVCDLTIFGVARSNGTATVQDDLTGTTILDSSLAMYTLGEIAGTNSTNFGYSRFTTATASGNTYTTPWLVGSTFPSGNCKIGTLYSCTGSSCSCGTNCQAALWECLGGSTWKYIQ